MDTKVNADGIIYVPQSDTYRIKVGKRIVEVDAWALRQAWNIPQIESILRNGTDAGKNRLLDSIVRIGGRLVDDLGSDGNACGNGYVSSYDPIDALYRGAIDPADTIVACMDIPEPKPYYDPSAAPIVYHYSRFPSVNARTIIDEAIKLLNIKKNLHLTKVDVERVFDGFKIRMYSNTPSVKGPENGLVIAIKHTAFDRAYRTDIDMQAGLKAKLDTDTYIKLRIAFLLFEALKVDDYNNNSIGSGLCEVIYSSSEIRFRKNNY